jgi:hypothetical protein
MTRGAKDMENYDAQCLILEAIMSVAVLANVAMMAWYDSALSELLQGENWKHTCVIFAPVKRYS